jgi:hypothetical protein
MKRLLILLCFPALLQTHKGYGQDSTSKVSVVVSPAIFIPVSVAAQAGFNFQLSRRWSLLAEGAYPTFYPKDEVYEKIRYWRAGLELKYYFKRRKSAKYISLQNNYLFRELTNEENGVYYTKTETYAYTNAVIKSPVLSSALKIGLEVPLGKRTYFDLFAGGGVRMIFTRYKPSSALLTSIKPNEQGLLKFDDAWSYNYTLKRIHVTAGLRFGFRL